MFKRVIVFGIASLVVACSGGAQDDADAESQSGADQAVTAKGGAQQRAKDAWAKLMQGRFAVNADDSALTDISRTQVAKSARDGVDCALVAFSAARVGLPDSSATRFKRWTFEGTPAYAIISLVPFRDGRRMTEKEGPEPDAPSRAMFDLTLLDAKGAQLAAGVMGQSTVASTVLRWGALDADCPIAGGR